MPTPNFGPSLSLAALASFGTLLMTAAPSSAIDAEHLKIELISEHAGIGPGTSWVALRLVPEQGWHVYWSNPGDSGQPTSVKWTLPAGVEAGPIEWPAPHSFRFGPLTSYGYAEEVLHMVPIKVPAGFSGAAVPLKADVRWLVCAGVCVPGKATLSLDLPFSAKPNPDARWKAAFAAARAAVPREEKAAKASFAIAAGRLTMAIDGFPKAFPGPEAQATGKAEFFPELNDLVDHSAPQTLALQGGIWRLEQKLSPYFGKEPTEVAGVLVFHQGKNTQAFRIRALPASK